ncbi:MAG: signal recognition particle receptor subunit alpha, partial [Acidobacteriaceae bacterium]|nr:signal recognition particle receptor subunit alpha [Acidobacteriaceae bacterium]
ALLEADVHFKVVKQFIEQVKDKAMGEEVLTRRGVLIPVQYGWLNHWSMPF